MPIHAAPFKPMPSNPHTSIDANPQQPIQIDGYQYQPIKFSANPCQPVEIDVNQSLRNKSVATMDWNAVPRVAAFAVFTDSTVFKGGRLGLVRSGTKKKHQKNTIFDDEQQKVLLYKLLYTD